MAMSRYDASEAESVSVRTFWKKDTFKHLLSGQAIAGLTSGLISSLAVYPIDVVITRMQAHDVRLAHVPKYQNVFSALLSISRTEGLRSLYVGVVPNLIGNMSSWGLYFAGYAFFREKACERVAEIDNKPVVPGDLGPLENLACSMAAGCVTAIITQPIWLVNTRLQLQHWTGVRYNGSLHCIKEVLQTDGICGLFRGLVPSVVLVSHVALHFMAYEELKKGMLKDNEQQCLSQEQTCIAASAAKFFATSMTYPAQVIRTRLQQVEIKTLDSSAPHAVYNVQCNTGQRYYQGALDVVCKILQFEGVHGLYKGMATTLVRAVPSTALFFCVYETTVRHL